MTEIERLKKRAEKLRGLNVKHRAEILRLREESKKNDAEITRLEGEVESLVEIIQPGSWGK